MLVAILLLLTTVAVITVALPAMHRAAIRQATYSPRTAAPFAAR